MKNLSNFFGFRSFILVSLFVAITACGEATVSEDANSGNTELNDSTHLPQANENAVLSQNLQEFISRSSYTKRGSGSAISVDDRSNFIKTAMEYTDGVYHYYDHFEYLYGTLLYQNDRFAAVTFELDGDDGFNELNAVILGTYSLETGKAIHAAVITESSYYESSSLHTNFSSYELLIPESNDTSEYAFYIIEELTITWQDAENPEKGEAEDIRFEYGITESGEILLISED